MQSIEETVKYLERHIKYYDDMAAIEEAPMFKDAWLDRSWYYTVVLGFINEDPDFIDIAAGE